LDAKQDVFEVSAKGPLPGPVRTQRGAVMTRIAIALLLLALTGCVQPMPLHDEDNRLMNKTWPGENAQGPWTPRMLFE
jgi:hypothetical protein